ncbi:MAG: tryptophan--tRNA ligase, partial [Candidatus Terrybacteria bacterium]|nr:tryptophan--tRNA ligase [Candidatus Terrybacteria bacterium]
GHYFGVIPELLKLQKEADRLFLMIADLHALTTLEDSKNLAENSLILANTYLACGINPEKTTIFLQSQMTEHIELTTLLSMITPVSILELNPTYKEMKTEHPKNNNLGLLSYPVLQAADILVYKATHVPVGKDQAPHIELAREIARRFNNRFGKVFPEPKTILQKESKILSLQDPRKKMSKSHEKESFISLLDSPEAVRKKIKIAITDSGKEIKYDKKKKPAISNLLTIYNLFSGKPIKEIEKNYKGRGYADFKRDLAEVIIAGLALLQKKYKELEKNPAYVKSIIKQGAITAKQTASTTMEAVRGKIGFLNI